VVVGDRGVVGALEVDRDRARVGAALAVVDRVVERARAGAAGVGVGGEGDRAGVEDDRAARGVVDAGDGERVAVGVGVVGDEVGRVDGYLAVLDAGRRVVVGDGRVLDAREVDGHVARVGAAVAVVERVVERGRVVAAQVGVGRERDGAAGVGHAAAARVGHAAHRERVGVGVAVVRGGG